MAKEDDLLVWILGTPYKIIYGTSNEYEELKEMDGFTDTSSRRIVVDDMSMVENEVGSKKDVLEYRKQVVRHELIHAFLHESGLSNNTVSASSWATNEEMVDWMSIQFPKILRVFEDAKCL